MLAEQAKTLVNTTKQVSDLLFALYLSTAEDYFTLAVVEDTSNKARRALSRAEQEEFK